MSVPVILTMLITAGLWTMATCMWVAILRDKIRAWHAQREARALSTSPSGSPLRLPAGAVPAKPLSTSTSSPVRPVMSSKDVVTCSSFCVCSQTLYWVNNDPHTICESCGRVWESWNVEEPRWSKNGAHYDPLMIMMRRMVASEQRRLRARWLGADRID